MLSPETASKPLAGGMQPVCDPRRMGVPGDTLLSLTPPIADPGRVATYGLIWFIWDIEPLPGTVSAGMVSGAAIKSTPSANRMAAVP